MDAASGLAGAGRHPRVDAGPVRRQAATGGPGSQPSRPPRRPSRPRGRCSPPPRQRDVEQRRQPAARLDLGRRPVAVLRGATRAGSRPYLSRYIRQIARFSCGPGRSRKNVASNRSARANSGGSREMSLAVQTTNDVARPVVQPGQQRAEQPGRDARVARRPPDDAGQGLLDLVDHHHARRHRVDQPQRLADVGLGLARRASPAAPRRRGPASAGPSRCPAPCRRRSCPSPAARAGARPGPGRPLGSAGPQGARAERLERLQAAEVGERLAAPVQASAGPTS